MLYKSHFGCLPGDRRHVLSAAILPTVGSSSPEWQQAYQEILQAWDSK
jgi:hypothetical protein